MSTNPGTESNISTLREDVTHVGRLRWRGIQVVFHRRGNVVFHRRGKVVFRRRGKVVFRDVGFRRRAATVAAPALLCLALVR